MITHYHDYGWGPQWPIKQIEQEIVDQYLAPLIQSDQRVILINSTWYGRERHDHTMLWLQQSSWDIVVLVSMIDAPIPDTSWFQQFDRPIMTIGSVPGACYISLWAEIVARYISPYQEHAIDLPFMCLNRKPHWHRVKLYEQMLHKGVADQGLVSLGGSPGSPAVCTVPGSICSNDLAPNGAQHHHGIPNDIVSLGDLANWSRHFLNIVTETVFDVDDKYFVSEKIFKPIVGSRPFLVYAAGGAERWCRDQGFEPYLDDFRDISDLDLRDAANLVPFLEVLCGQDIVYWQRKYLDLLPKIQYNLQRFHEFVAEQRHRIQKGISCPI